MSNFRNIQTSIKDSQCLQSGLKNLGYDPQSNGTKQVVRGHGSEKLYADIILTKESLKLGGDVGFNKKDDGTYELVYDSYVAKLNKEEFLTKVTQAYGKAKVKKQMAQYPGFRLVEQKDDATGTTKMIFQEA